MNVDVLNLMDCEPTDRFPDYASEPLSPPVGPAAQLHPVAGVSPADVSYYAAIRL